MGSQWITMGRDLLKIEIFKKTFDRCAHVLKKYNIDLYHVVTTADQTVFDDISINFVAITAIEVALTDLLYALNIVPDNFAGHSLGEVGK